MSRPEPKKSTRPYTVYITLQFLCTIDEQNKYHWGLYVTDNNVPEGTLFHATDQGRRALDLYMEIRPVSDPMKSKTLTACLILCRAPSVSTIKSIAAQVPLMDPRHIPHGEVQWTCRVWVNEVLRGLERQRMIKLPGTIESIEHHAVRAADTLRRLGAIRLINELDWMISPPHAMGNNTPVRYYGPSPMDTEVEYRGDRRHGHGDRYYGPSPMETEVHHPAMHRPGAVEVRRDRYYGPSPMETEVHHPAMNQPGAVEVRRDRYYGPSPMETEVHHPAMHQPGAVEVRRDQYQGQRPAAGDRTYQYVNVIRR
ncbi:hypothetical protein MY10362_000168 [Beauveria mimosiformis]